MLETGARGDDVAWLQAALTRLGHAPGVIDGIFAESTAAAVRRFQAAARVPESGALDRGHARALASALTRASVADHVSAASRAERAGEHFLALGRARREEAEAAAQRGPARGLGPAGLPREEAAAAQLGAARNWIAAASHWRHASALAEDDSSRSHGARGSPLASARAAAKIAADDFDRAAADYDRMHDSLSLARALEGAAQAAALAANAEHAGPVAR